MGYTYNEVKHLYEDVLQGKRLIFPAGLWDDFENAKHATRYLLEERLCWSDEEIKEKLTIYTFRENKLGGMIKCFNSSPYGALNLTYPNRFKPWELQSTPLNTWNAETGAEAVRWMVEEKYKWSEKDVREYIDLKSFHAAGLSRMMSIIFKSSVIDALEAAYPGKYKEGELEYYLPTWTPEKGAATVRDLFENKLKWTDLDIRTKPLYQVFNEYKLDGMLLALYDRSIYSAVNAAYPGKYKPWELHRVAKGFWNMETGIEATKWLVEKHCEGNPKKATFAKFKNHKMVGMLEQCFGGSIKKALQETFPAA